MEHSGLAETDGAKTVKLTWCKSFELFWYKQCCVSSMECLKKKKWKLFKLYEAGEDRLTRDFDVINVLR